jgi:hypothetical protein
VKVKDILIADAPLTTKRQPLFIWKEVRSWLWLITRAFGLGFLLIGLVTTGIVLSIENGLIVRTEESYSPPQLVDKICKENGGWIHHAVFHIENVEYMVNICVWGLDAPRDETSPGTSRGIRPPDSDDAASPVNGAAQEPQIDT